jgi:hypothetical protein
MAVSEEKSEGLNVPAAIPIAVVTGHVEAKPSSPTHIITQHALSESVEGEGEWEEEWEDEEEEDIDNEEPPVPSFVLPITEQPRAEQPRIEQPRMEQPRTEQPRIEQPRIEQPRMEQPRIEQPRTLIDPPPIEPVHARTLNVAGDSEVEDSFVPDRDWVRSQCECGQRLKVSEHSVFLVVIDVAH